METKQSDKSNGQSLSNVIHNNNSNSKQLTTNEPIENTPFRLIGNEQTGYGIVIGAHRLTTPKPTKKEALDILKNEQWNIIANMIVAVEQNYRTIENMETLPNK